MDLHCLGDNQRNNRQKRGLSVAFGKLLVYLSSETGRLEQRKSRSMPVFDILVNFD